MSSHSLSYVTNHYGVFTPTKTDSESPEKCSYCAKTDPRGSGIVPILLVLVADSYVGLGQYERTIRTCSDLRSSRFVRDKSVAGGMDSTSAIVPRRSECVMLQEPVEQTALPALSHGSRNV